MSRLAVRLLLTLFVLPVGTAVHIGTMLVLEKWWWATNFAIAGLATWICVAVCVFAIWGKTVRWAFWRRLILLGVAIAGLIAGWAAWSMPHDHHFFGDIDYQIRLLLLGIAIPALWLFATVLVCWETTAERSARIGATRPGKCACASCGYNLTGLPYAQCPRCGEAAAGAVSG